MSNSSNRFKSVALFNLLVVLLVMLATWLIVTPPMTSWLNPHLEASNTQLASADVSVSDITSTTQAEEVPKNLENTIRFPIDTTQLHLVGVVLSTNNSSSHAIIEYLGKQNSYAIGDNVAHPKVLLTGIMNDQAVIQYRQQPYVLHLLKRANRSDLPAHDPDISKVQNRQTTNFPQHDQYISVTPVYEQGVLMGLSATPKGDTSVFLQLGLMSDDIITEINGVSMTDREEIGQAQELLQTSNTLQLSVSRQGQDMTVFINSSLDIL